LEFAANPIAKGFSKYKP